MFELHKAATSNSVADNFHGRFITKIETGFNYYCK